MIRLSRAFFAEYARHHEELFRIGVLRDEEITDYFRRFLERDDHAVFVAGRDNVVLGYITVCVQVQPSHWAVRRIGHISGLMVRKEDRRRGMGTRLLEQAQAFFREQGVKYYTVYTAAVNGEAIDFYRHHGLEPLHSSLVGMV